MTADFAFTFRCNGFGAQSRPPQGVRDVWRRLIGVLSASAMPLAPPADAMRFKLVRTNPNVVLIIAQGEFAVNEIAAFKAALQDVPPRTPMIGLVVNSGGGNVLAAEEMAALIHTGGIGIAVTSGAVCASACFLLFAASPHRFAAPGALIGVHSVAPPARTRRPSRPRSLFERDASGYAAAGILGRLVATPPGQFAWLTRAELAAMRVVFMTAQPLPHRTSPPPPRQRRHRPARRCSVAASPTGPRGRHGSRR